MEVATDHWHPSAAYLYVLHLDGPALAWEYLRRHPDYRRDWLRRRRDSGAARRWGLRLLEDPALDARDAHPAWFPDHDGVVQLYPDADPPPDAQRFTLWHLPGHKHLIHDGRRLLLVARWPACCVRFAMAAELEDGMAYAYAVRACPDPFPRCHLFRDCLHLAMPLRLAPLTDGGSQHETRAAAAACRTRCQAATRSAFPLPDQ